MINFRINILNSIFYKLGVLATLFPWLFFAFNAIWGKEYEGFQESNLYAILVVVFTSSFSIYYLYKRLKKKNYLLVEILWYFILILTPTSIIFASFSNRNVDISNSYLFLSIVFPIALFAIVFAKSNNLILIFKYYVILCQIFYLSIFFVIPKMLSTTLNDLVTFFGGGHYQGFGYIISFSFLVNLLYYLFFLKRKTILLVIYFNVLFLTHFVAIVLSGARGSMIVLILGLFIFSVIKSNIYVILIKLLKGLILLIPTITLLLHYFRAYNDRIFDSFNRLFEYIGDNGLDLSKTSNRDILYLESLKYIERSPYLGYGFFNYLNYVGFGYPHNFFLELLLQGGLLYLVFWIVILIFFFMSLYKLIKSDQQYLVILPFVIYSFIQLLFSGSYILEPFFWFSIIFVFTSRFKVIINRNKN